jgi:chromosomal replication initiator protein
LLAHNLAAQHQSAIQHSTANQLNSTSQNIAAERKPASAGRCSTALYSGSDFVRAVVNAIDTDRVAEFRRKLRQTRFIIIDGLEELLTSAITQQELAHLLDACGEQRADVENQFDHQQQTAAAASQSHGFGNQLVITARELPVEIASLDRRLASRLMNGLCVPIQAPGPAARRVLLVRLSEWLGTSLTESAVDAMADGVPGLLPANSTVLDINQVLIRLSQAEPGPEKPIGIERFTACSSQSDSPEVVLKRVVTEVARSFGVRVADMTGPSRRQGVVRARGVAMYLARHQMALSLDMIGQYFGNRDHTTVLHACRKTQRLCDSDDAVRDVIAKLETEFFNAIPSSPFTTRHRRS